MGAAWQYSDKDGINNGEGSMSGPKRVTCGED